MKVSRPRKLNIKSAFIAPATLALLLACSADALADERDNSLTAMVANKVMVKIDGNKKVSNDDLKGYFKSIDFKAIKEYAQ